jgi:hypothetical protein
MAVKPIPALEYQRYSNKCLKPNLGTHILSACDYDHLSGEIRKALLWIKTVGEKHDKLIFLKLDGEV